MNSLPQTPSESVKKLNPHLWPGGSVGAVEGAVRKSTQVSALDGGQQKPQRMCKGVVVCIVSFRRKLLDDDNLTGGAKSLRDTIAIALGVDDADPRLCWEYAQVKTTGPEGTLVVITATNKP